MMILALAVTFAPVIGPNHSTVFRLPTGPLEIVAMPLPVDGIRSDGGLPEIEWERLAPFKLPADRDRSKLERVSYLRAFCRIGSDRRLSGCEIEDHRPKDAVVRTLLLQPLHALTVSKDFYNRHKAELREVIVGIRATIDEAAGTGGLEHCIDPFCTTVPSPPPPPLTPR